MVNHFFCLYGSETNKPIDRLLFLSVISSQRNLLACFLKLHVLLILLSATFTLLAVNVFVAVGMEWVLCQCRLIRSTVNQFHTEK